jgi:hypothetical protein
MYNHFSMARPIFNGLIKQFGNDKISFIYCNCPLNDIHPILSMQLKWLNLLWLEVNSERCMIICVNIKNH